MLAKIIDWSGRNSFLVLDLFLSIWIFVMTQALKSDSTRRKM